MTTRFGAAVRVFAALAAILLAGASGLRGQSTGTLLRYARMQLEDIQPDSAAALLARVLDPHQNAGAAEQARAWTLLGTAELMRGRMVGARVAFRHALERDPSLSVDSLAYLHSDLRRVFALERESFRVESDEGPPTVTVRLTSDTVITPNAGQWPIEVEPRRPARVIATLARATARADIIWSDTEAVNLAGVIGWDLRVRGTPVGPGRYVLRVMATDTMGRVSAPVTRTLTITRAAVDTVAMPDPPTDSLLPDSDRSAFGSPRPVLAGIALGAGALALTSLAGNSSLNSGRSDGGRFVIAGAVSLASIIGFLGNRHERALPANENYNGELRRQFERRRQEAEAENARRLAASPLRIRTDAR